jgi:predicted membrane protein
MSPDVKLQKTVESLVGVQRVVQFALGLLIVAAGVLFTLDNLHILHAMDYLVYWPVVFIVIGIAQIVQGLSPGRGGNPTLLFGALWILIGSAMISQRLGLTHLNVWDFWPAVLVIVGGRIIWHGYHGRPRPETITDQLPKLGSTALMSGFNRRVVSQMYQGGDLTAIMGGGRLDLREAAMADGQAAIDLFVIMGGFEILVPSSWNVIIEITPFMGGFDDKTRPPTDPTAPRLFIRGFVMMGGVEIKN